jgi:hypothetical protein
MNPLKMRLFDSSLFSLCALCSPVGEWGIGNKKKDPGPVRTWPRDCGKTRYMALSPLAHEDEAIVSAPVAPRMTRQVSSSNFRLDFTNERVGKDGLVRKKFFGEYVRPSEGCPWQAGRHHHGTNESEVRRVGCKFTRSPIE